MNSIAPQQRATEATTDDSIKPHHSRHHKQKHTFTSNPAHKSHTKAHRTRLALRPLRALLRVRVVHATRLHMLRSGRSSERVTACASARLGEAIVIRRSPRAKDQARSATSVRPILRPSRRSTNGRLQRVRLDSSPSNGTRTSRISERRTAPPPRRSAKGRDPIL